MYKKMIGIALVTVSLVIVLIGLVIVIPLTSYVSANNTAARFESQIEAAWKNNKTILSTHQQKVLEVAQVPEMYKNDFKEVIAVDVQGRYGKDGSSATMQWIKEHEIHFDSSMYTRLQQVIEAGRTEFNVGQQRLIDVMQMYETQRNSVWTGLWMRIAGYPKKDLTQFKIVTTARTENAFETGLEAAPLKLR